MSILYRTTTVSIIVCSIVLAACDIASNKDNLEQREIPSLKEHYPLALSEAQTWHEDAYVFWADISMNNEYINLSYIFGSSLFPQDEQLVELRLNGETIKITTFEDTIDPPKRKTEPIPIEDTILDAPEVFKMALQRGGSSFITSHQDITDILIQLVPLSGAAAEEIGGETFQPVWRVAFSDNSTSIMNLLFDPFTGEYLGSITRE